MSEAVREAVLKPRPGTQSKFLRFLANLVSYVFHPVFMPTIMAMLLYKLSATSFTGISAHDYFGKWVSVIIINTLIFPLIATLLLKALGFIQSIHMYDAKDRIIPLIASMVFYFWGYHVFSNIDSPFILKVLLLGSFWGVIVLFMANIFVKVSMHTMAAGGALGLIIVLMAISPVSMMLPFFLFLLVAGIIGTARMLLGVHLPFEIWAGYVLGIVTQLAAYWYLL